MKNLLVLLITVLVIFITFTKANAWTLEGYVFCDTNQNEVIDFWLDDRLSGVTVEVSGDNSEKLIKLIDALEDCDDVQNVYSNANFVE